MTPHTVAPNSRPQVANAGCFVALSINSYNVRMNPNLNKLQPYPFQKLRELFHGIQPNASLTPVNLSIGEPKHATPAFIKEALAANLGGLANYPMTVGSAELRQAISAWLARRYDIPAPDPDKAII